MRQSFIILAFLIFIIICAIIYSSSKNMNPVFENFSNKVIHRKIYIIYTGGTIGMVESPQGLIPKSGFLEKKLKEMTKDYEGLIGDYTIKEFSPLLDSSNMTPKDWLTIADEINQNYHDYDAFIVIHGTDTLAYTSSALSFMFENLGKPVVVTGSMVALSEIRSDGQTNLIDSLIIASQYDIPEVIVVFDNQVMRGNRVTKVNSNSFQAFASPNFPNIGKDGVNFSINHSLIIRPTGSFRLVRIDPRKKIIAVRLFPGINARYLSSILMDPSIYGVVLLTFGIGDAPTDKDFLNVIKTAIDSGIIFVNCTQDLMGQVSETDYATGSSLKDAGVLSGYDMTTEAAIGKLYYLMAAYQDRDTIKRLVGVNLRGELTTYPSLYQQTGTFI